MAGDIKILDAQGNQMVPKAPSKLSAISDSGGVGGSSPYDSANQTNNRMSTWQPFLGSPDQEINVYRDRIVSRSRDITRNDGWAAGAVTRVLDNIVGGSFRPISKPDYRALQAATGNKKFDAQWASEYGRELEAHYRSWANDPNHYCDASRKQTVSQMLYLALRHELIDGDSLATVLWEPGRIGHGKAKYATTIQVVDPDRLSNPQNQYDNQTWRGGVAVDHLGAPTGYYIRRAHLGDWFNANDAMIWDLIPRETAWGRPMVVHNFTADRAGQHRGGLGIFNPVMQRLKMLTQYDGAELDQAVINAIFGAYITSPFDPEIVKSALGDGNELNAYQNERIAYHNGRKISLGGARMPHLFPGEEIKTVKAEHPSSAFKEFQSTFLRNIASATGLSYEQISSDWSQSNYSSARGAIVEAWKTLSRRRSHFASGFANPIFSAFAEECFNVDGLPLPSGAPEFAECRGLYSACRWLGPSRGAIDLVKEVQGSMLAMEAGLSTLESEAEVYGEDWEETIDQRKTEIDAFNERGIPVPSWGHESDEVVQTEKIG